MSLYLSILLALVLTIIGITAILRQRNSGRGRNRERLIFVRNKTRF